MIKQQESEQEAEKLETWAKLRFLAVTSQNVNVGEFETRELVSHFCYCLFYADRVD